MKVDESRFYYSLGLGSIHFSIQLYMKLEFQHSKFQVNLYLCFCDQSSARPKLLDLDLRLRPVILFLCRGKGNAISDYISVIILFNYPGSINNIKLWFRFYLFWLYDCYSFTVDFVVLDIRVISTVSSYFWKLHLALFRFILAVLMKSLSRRWIKFSSTIFVLFLLIFKSL